MATFSTTKKIGENDAYVLKLTLTEVSGSINTNTVDVSYTLTLQSKNGYDFS